MVYAVKENKCLEEISNDVYIYTASQTTTEVFGGSSCWSNVNFDYPEGFNAENTLIVGLTAVVYPDDQSAVSIGTFGSDWLNNINFDSMNGSNPAITVGFYGLDPVEYGISMTNFSMTVNIALMKV